jgi:hypothetical protein
MADICLAYSRKNEDSAQRLVQHLSILWDVWWDDKIIGKFPTAIELEIPKSKCLVTIWSEQSRANVNVRDEIHLAEAHGIPIIAVRIDGATAPYGFSDYSSIDMKYWDGDTTNKGYQKLLRHVTSIIPPSTKPIRLRTLANCSAKLPAVFLSVSSHETQIVPKEAIKVLRVFGASTILVSAYDFLPERRPTGTISQLREFRRNGGVVLLDSGNYEATRLGDASWNPDTFRTAIKDVPHDFAFCFDVMSPNSNPSKAVAEVLAAVERDSKFTTAQVLPIVHAPRLKKGGHFLESLPAVVRKIAEASHPPMIAVPERELGPGLMRRAATVRKIRDELDKLPFYQPLHLLGTGNPWSIAVLLAAGADSFDGLEWCRMAVDSANDRLHHFQHFDFFAYQARVAKSPITSGALNDEHVDFAGRVAFHNLEYYMDFTSRLQDATTKGNFEPLVIGIIGKDNGRQLNTEVPELFR